MLSKTGDKSFRELFSKFYYYDSRRKIAYEDEIVFKMANKRIRTVCPICNTDRFTTRKELMNHVACDHGKKLCKLCLEHRMVFTFEQKCYTEEVDECPSFSIHIVKRS